MPDARLQRTREAYQPTVVKAPTLSPFCTICGARVSEQHHACCRQALQLVAEPTEDTPWGV